MLEIKDITVSYSDKLAIKNININVNKGEIVGLIGVNGSGKSTLFHSVLGLIKFQKGEVILDGEKLKYDKSGLRSLRKDITLVMQDPDRQIFYSTVMDDLLFPLRNIKVPEDDAKMMVNKVMKRIGMEYLKDRFVQGLSFGEKKRVTIAGAMLLNPKYLFLDEPTAGLDPRLTREMKGILKELRSDMGLIISSHDMEFIYDVCDRIYVIKEGEIMCSGTPDEVFCGKERSVIEDEWGLSIPLQLK